jgi:transposase
MFQDEARFGRISEGAKCWALPGNRPLIGAQIVRQYTYAYAALSPFDGVMDSFILPDMYTDTLSIFLAKVSERHKKEFIVMVLDGAPCHRSGTLAVPANLRLVEQPSYSPELNPVEHLWEEIQEKWFANKTFNTMHAVIKKLVTSLRTLEQSPQQIQSLAGFSWILNSLRPYPIL